MKNVDYQWILFGGVPLASVMNKLARAPPKEAAIPKCGIESITFEKGSGRSNWCHAACVIGLNPVVRYHIGRELATVKSSDLATDATMDEIKIVGGIVLGYSKLSVQAMSVRERAKRLCGQV